MTVIRLLLLLVLAVLIGAPGVARATATQGSAIFTVTTTNFVPAAGFDPKNIAVVWVEDSGGRFVKTLCRHASVRMKWLSAWTNACYPFTNYVDGVTGATITSQPTVHTVVWDGRDTNGVIVADGTYVFRAEYTSFHAQGPFLSNQCAFVKGPNAMTANYPDVTSISNGQFTAMSLTYTPAADIGITGMTPSSGYLDSNVTVTVSISNHTANPASFQVALSNLTPTATLIGLQSAGPLAGFAGTNVTFNWNTTGLGAGASWIAAYAGPIVGETNTADNVFSNVVTLAANNTRTITATAGTGGSIAPSGAVTVTNGNSQTFMIAPDSWYVLGDVAVDSVSVGAVSSYTFDNVTVEHTIAASFTALLAPQGTPLWWLAQYGYTNDFAAAELADPDVDGVPNGQEYLDGTDPTNPLSRVVWNRVPYAESFENLAGWGGQYGSVLGHKGWSSSSPLNDRSRITNQVYTFSATNYPLPGATHTNVLQLDNNGAVLSNSFGSGFDMSSAMTYFDAMVQFGKADGLPPVCTPIDTGTKGGAFINSNNCLTIYHGVAAVDGTLLSNQVDATSAVLDPTNWYRLTLIIDATATNPANALAMFQVKLNGVVVTNAAGYDDTWKALFNVSGQLPALSANGTWFRTATTNGAAKLLTALALTGSACFDDLVVTTIDPFAPPAAGTFTLILVQAGNGSTSLGTSPFTAVSIAADATTQIVYTASDWYRINSLASNGVPVTAASGAQAFTQALVNINSDVSNNVAFALATPDQTGFTNVPTAWLTNWPESAVYAGGNDGFNVSVKYLLGLDPTASNSYALTVDSFQVASNNVIITLKRTVSGALSPDGMHGNLALQATSALGTAFTNIAGTEVTGATVFDGSGHKAYTNAVSDSNRFFKAVVE